MNVLVVARTRMGGDRVCVGGIDVDSAAGVRLLGHDGQNMGEDHAIRPREVWTVKCSARPGVRPPHVEDVIVTSGKKVDEVTNLRRAIEGLIKPWDCRLDKIFEGRLQATPNGSAFIRDDPPLPSCSTGFWIANTIARKSKFDEHGARYWFPDEDRIRKVKYVGMDEPVAVIDVGSLIRFSLARWAEFPPGIGEERCWLQLSDSYR